MHECILFQQCDVHLRTRQERGSTEAVLEHLSRPANNEICLEEKGLLWPMHASPYNVLSYTQSLVNGRACQPKDCLQTRSRQTTRFCR